MKQTLYQIDAFTDSTFGGNPAAVCILNEWLEDSLMQKIALENNLSETAFAVKKNGLYEIRWFTPTVEIDLCGHATLATAFVLFRYFETDKKIIELISHRSGSLKVTLENTGKLTLDFPIDVPKITDENLALNNAIGKTPKKSFKSSFDYMLVYDSQKEIESIQPDLNALSKIETRGVIVTSPGENVDFVSRYFAPASGIDEDPVTGSAHCTLTPYWKERLNKETLTAKQVSKRVGELSCKLKEDRVYISGKCVLYMIGEIYL